MKTILQKITPDMAHEWLLAANTNNRKLRARTVVAFAADMRRGKWQITHQGIAFNDTGRLIDGQHRLAAIVKSGCTVQILVTTGIPSETKSGKTMDAIDRGNARSIGDALHLTYGVKNANATAALIASVVLLLFRSWHQRVRRITAAQCADILALLRGDIEVILEVIYASSLARSFGASAIPAALVIACQRHREKAIEFARKLISGAGLDEQSPILALRNAALGGKSFGGNEAERLAAMYLVLGRIKEHIENTPPKPNFRRTAEIYTAFVSTEFEEQLAAILGLRRDTFEEVEVQDATPPAAPPVGMVDAKTWQPSAFAASLIKGKEMSDRAHGRALRNGM